jgi:hypothetical protein
MRSDRKTLQAARQGSGRAGAAHNTRQPKFTLVDQGVGKCKAQTAQTDHCYL